MRVTSMIFTPWSLLALHYPLPPSSLSPFSSPYTPDVMKWMQTVSFLKVFLDDV